MRFTWLSNGPHTCSGYGNQTRLFVPRLQDLGHQFAVISYYGLDGGVLNLGGVTILPKHMHPYGNDVCVAHTLGWGANAMFSLMDTWVMEPEGYPLEYRWIPWTPVDHEPMPLIIRRKLSLAHLRIAMSRYGESEMHNAGLECMYVPHGLDPEFYPRDKMQCRRDLKLPEDAWIVGSVAMNKGNPSRKNFFEMMSAFANFKKRHTDAVYFLQTDRGDKGGDVVNLPELALSLGLEPDKDVIFPSPYQVMLGYPIEYFAKLYSALDVHMTVSAGEGFGIPIIEAQACGCPVIVGDWTAMGELCHAGQKVDKKDAIPFWTPLAAYQYRPVIRAVELAMEAERRKPSPCVKAGEYIRQEYSVDNVMEKYWKPAMDKIVSFIEMNSASMINGVR